MLEYMIVCKLYCNCPEGEDTTKKGWRGYEEGDAMASKAFAPAEGARRRAKNTHYVKKQQQENDELLKELGAQRE